mgnify:CR=1 FL=1
MPTDDDDLLPKKLPRAKEPSRAERAASPAMIRLMRITRAVGIALGGFVTLVALMGVVGFATDNFWVRLVVALVVVVGLPAFAADRLLKRTGMKGGLALVADVFAIVLLGFALVVVSAEPLTKGIFVREGDRYARSGSRGMARFVYFLGGVAPVFPEEPGWKGEPGASGAAAPSASPSASGAAPDAGAR